MAMLRVCAHPECGTLTLGELCIEHEQPQARRVRIDGPAVRRRPRRVQEVHAAVAAEKRRPGG